MLPSATFVAFREKRMFAVDDDAGTLYDVDASSPLFEALISCDSARTTTRYELVGRRDCRLMLPESDSGDFGSTEKPAGSPVIGVAPDVRESVPVEVETVRGFAPSCAPSSRKATFLKVGWESTKGSTVFGASSTVRSFADDLEPAARTTKTPGTKVVPAG